MKSLLLWTGTAILSILAATAWAQAYPTKPIRMIVPFAPGGGTDTQARALALRLSDAFGQTIVVDNRPGAGGSIGAEMTVRAEPDGYTLIIVSGSYGANAALYTLPYDPITDIRPIVLIGETGLVCSVHPSVTVKSVKELIAHARANPGKLNFGSAGTGGLGHLAGELFKLETKTNIVHVPYKGSGPVMTALLSGEIHTSFSSMVPSIPHIRAGRLRALGVTTPKRAPALPDVPTVAETIPGYDVIHWYGMWGPKKLPDAIVTRWNGEVARLLQTEEFKTRLAAEGMTPGGAPPEAFAAFLRQQVQKWRRAVKEGNISIGK